MKLTNILMIAAIAVVLSGCGGGGGGGSSIIDPPADTTGPTFTVPPMAVYDGITGSVIFTASVTDASGIGSINATVNGKTTILTLVSGSNYTGTYDAFPDNFGATDLVYTAVVTAYDKSTNANHTSSNAVFTVPVVGPPPPPPIN